MITYDADGKAVKGTAIQPTSGRQLLDVPEGVRTKATSFLWIRASVKVRDEIETSNAAAYKVVHLWPREEAGFNRAALGLLKR